MRPEQTPGAVSDGRGTLDELAAFQRAGWANLVLSVTQSCPLRCAHCITESGPSAGAVLSVEQARSWAAEMCRLRAAGLAHLTFTGGEPTLARRAVAVLADAARGAGIRTSIVSSGAFARSADAAARTVRSLGDVDHWDLGFDTYHREWLPIERFVDAVNAVVEAERAVTVRVCRSADEAGTADVVRRIRTMCGPDVPITVQPVRRIGRAGDLDVPVPAGSLSPCLSTGPLVREDGSVAPCCSGLAYPRRPHLPFRFGDACEVGLVAVRRAWMEDQALRAMRLVGLRPVLDWLRSEGHPVPESASDVCELCTSLWDSRGRAAEIVGRRASETGVRERLDEVERAVHGAVWDVGVVSGYVPTRAGPPRGGVARAPRR